MKEKEYFEFSYASLRAMIVSSIFSLLGYTADEIRYAKSKHLNTLDDDWDHIYQYAPYFNEHMAYFLYSDRFNRLYGANVLIELHKNLNDIIEVKMNRSKRKTEYPVDIVQDIFQTASSFTRACLHPEERRDFSRWNFKMYKLFLCLEHERPKRLKLDLYNIELAFTETKSISELIHIIRYGYKMAFNKQLPVTADTEVSFYLNKENKLTEALTCLSMEIDSDESIAYSKLYQSFLKSHPITEYVYRVDTVLVRSILLIDFVKFIVDDPRLTKIIDRILYK